MVGARFSTNPSGENKVATTNETSGQSIRFPALSFSQGLVTIILSLDELNECRRLGFRKGYYKGLTLVDSVGNQFKVVGARKIKTLPFKFTFRDFLALLGANPLWQIELKFGSGRGVSLEETKKLILDSLRKEKHYWEEMCDFEEFRERIQSAPTLEQIFGAFREFNKM